MGISEQTRIAASSLVLRVILGLVIFAHGAQKMLGLFGGHGYRWTLDAWSKWFGFPEILTHVVIWCEFLAPIFLIIGLFTRYAATVIGVIMVGAIIFVHGQWGFFMNWYGQPKTGEGFEYHIMALGMVLGLLILGNGKWSLSYHFFRRKKKQYLR